MDLNSEHIVDFIRYATYADKKVALAILVNNALNMHIREDNILSYVHEPFEGRWRITLTLDPSLRSNYFGETYNGVVRVVYDKMDASTVYPTGFYTNKHAGSGEISISSLLDLLQRNTRVIIDMDEIDHVTIDDQDYLVFKDTSLFWKGRIAINSIDSIEYHPLGVD